MSKKNRIIILTSLITLMFVLIIGITYAYFSATTSGDEGSSIIVQTADMRLLFTDHGELRMNDVLPGDQVSKEFEVKNIGNADATYNIRWKGIYNEFINSELTIKLECLSYDSTNTLIGSCGNMTDVVGYTTNGSIKSNIPIAIGITHKYKATLTFIETGENQDYNQGKSFIGTLLIDSLDLNMTTIKGILLDENSSILANKVVEVHSDPISTITNYKGEFLIEGIEYGTHEIIIKDNNSEIGRKNILITTTTNNTSVHDSTSIYWNENQKSVVTMKIETSNKAINNIDINWMSTDAKCFEYDSASTAIIGYYCYEGNNKGYETITDVIIPNTITSINNAFESKKLTSITIPSSVTKIGDHAFFYNELTNVIIPSSVTSIGYGAFAHNKLTNVLISDSVTSIGNYAFEDNQLKSIIVPDSVTYIGYQAFNNNKLTNIDYPGGIEIIGAPFNKNPLKLDDPIMYYKNRDGSYDKSIIIGYINDGTSSVIIPDTVTTIKDYAFFTEDLTNVKLSNNLVTIGSLSFTNNKLTNIVIPEKVNTIGYSAFYNNLLTNVTISNGVKNISYGSFYNNKLTTVSIPKSVTYIGDEAFANNPNLTLIEIDNASGSISGSPWGAVGVTINYLK